MSSYLPGYSGRMLPLTILCALLLGAGLLVGCGGDDESATAETTAAATAPDNQAPEVPEEVTEKQQGGDEKAEAPEKKAEAPEKTEGGDEDASGAGQKDAVAVPPNRHKDSGGGSQQFRTKGGDNSIQDSGKEADQSTFNEVAAVVHAFLDARADGDFATTCRYLAGAVTDQLEQLMSQAPDAPKDCEGMIKAMTPPMEAKMRRAIAQADIGSVRVDGDTAFVLYRGMQKTVFVLPMAREDGNWKVATIAPSPMP